MLSGGNLPQNTLEILALAAVPQFVERASFAVAEGGQIPPDQLAGVDPGFRAVLAFRETGGWNLFVSTAAPWGDGSIFLQVMSWDDVAGIFRFFERRQGSWFLAGDSNDALADAMRGQGPFDSHINGAMVLKELKAPWLHWHSMAQSIPDTHFPANWAVGGAQIAAMRRGADELEKIVRQGIDRWTRVRTARVEVAGNRIEQPRWFLRQLLTATSANIASAPEPFLGAADAKLHVPLNLFFDRDALLDVIGLEVDIEGPPVVTRDRYAAAVARAGLRLQAGPFRQDGDAFFAWSVPERAFEDQNVLDHVLRQNWISPRVMAAFLMVDFTNPVESPARAALLDLMPTAPLDVAALEAQMIAAVPPAASPELHANLALAEGVWQTTYAQAIARYMARVQVRLDTDEGLDDILRLADSRRRSFRRRTLAEFDLTLPWTDTPKDAPLLSINPAAIVS